MRDWREVVRQKLAGLALEPEEKREVFEELAEHLEETYQSLLRKGISEEDAAQRALSEVSDWHDLRRKIDSARAKEISMTNRVTQFWFPGLLTFTISMGFLAVTQKFGPLPLMLRLDNPPVLMFYLPWLVSLPLVGAMGAYLSSRAGGSFRVMLFSSLFPVLPFVGLFLVGFPLSLLIEQHVSHNIMVTAFLMALRLWVLFPGVALLAGGLVVQLFGNRLIPSANGSVRLQASSSQNKAQ